MEMQSKEKVKNNWGIDDQTLRTIKKVKKSKKMNGSSRSTEDIERECDTSPTPDIPLSTPVKTSSTIIETVPIDVKTTVEESAAQSKGLHIDNA